MKIVVIIILLAQRTLNRFTVQTQRSNAKYKNYSNPLIARSFSTEGAIARIKIFMEDKTTLSSNV